MNFSSNLTRNSNDETNSTHKGLLTDTQVLEIGKIFANGLSTNIKFLKTKPSKMGSGRFIDPEY